MIRGAISLPRASCVLRAICAKLQEARNGRRTSDGRGEVTGWSDGGTMDPASGWLVWGRVWQLWAGCGWELVEDSADSSSLLMGPMTHWPAESNALPERSIVIVADWLLETIRSTRSREAAVLRSISFTETMDAQSPSRCTRPQPMTTDQNGGVGSVHSGVPWRSEARRQPTPGHGTTAPVLHEI